MPTLRLAILMALLLGGVHAQTLIQSVDELVAAFAGGGDYRIAPGTYALDASLDVAGELAIVGAGADAVTIEARGGPIAVRVGEGARLHLEGVRLVWVGDAPGDLVVVRDGGVTLRGVDLGMAKGGSFDPPDAWRPGGHGSSLVLQGASEAVLEGVRIARSETAAVEVLGSSSLLLVEAQLVDNFRGIVALQEARLDVRGGVFLDQFAQAVVLIDDAQATFLATGFGGNGLLDAEREQFLEAILVRDRARATFDGGVLRDAPAVGIGASGHADVVVTGMLLEANGGVLVDAGRSWPAVFVGGEARVAVRDATVRGGPGGAFDVRQSGALVLEGTTVEGNGGFGHTAVAGDGRLAVQGSRFVGNDGALVVIGDARAGIYDSELIGGGASGLIVGQSASVDVVGNTIADHEVRGVWIDGSASADLTGNTITGNEMGLWMTGSSTAFVTENHINDQRHSGAVLLGGSRAVFVRNEIAGNAVNGVALADETGGVLESNQLLGNGVNGLLIGGAATGTLEGNTISGSESGVRLEGDGVGQGTDNVFADNGRDVTEVR